MKAALFFMACTFAFLAPLATRAVEADPKWTVYIEDGKSPAKAVDLLPAATPVENYVENLARVSPEMTTDPSESLTSPFTPENLIVTEIGTWHDYVVYDLRNDAVGHRSIVLKDEIGNHRILFTQYCMATVSAENAPFILTVQGQTLLVYRAQIPGTGNFFLEYYFQFHPETRLPSALSLEPIEAKLKEILPKGMAVWKGGGFDIATLTYNHAVWQERDGNCCPTAGRVSMKLEIRDNALVVVESNYDPKALRE